MTKETIWYRTNDYPVTPFSIESNKEMDAAAFRLQEIANKFGSRNANARKIGDLLRVFHRSVMEQTGGRQPGQTVEVVVDYAPLLEAIAIDEAARGAAQQMKACGRGGCQNRIKLTERMCARCAHDEE